MSKPHDASPTPGLPALQVQYGQLQQKWWPLQTMAVVIGRSRGCDLVLDSVEISQVHCVLMRGPDGWSVRDCGSRNGTRVNGELITTTRLRDEDVLKIGPFSFIACLPDTSTENREEKLQRRELELQRQAELLRGRVREYEQRAERLEKAERDLAQDRKVLDQGFAELHRRQKQLACGQPV